MFVQTCVSILIQHDVHAENIQTLSTNTVKNENTESFKLQFYVDGLINKIKLWKKEITEIYNL